MGQPADLAEVQRATMRLAMLERLLHPIRRLLLRIVAKSGFLCSVYYAACSSSFRREHRGVVCGRLPHTRRKHKDDGKGCHDRVYTLRWPVNPVR